MKILRLLLLLSIFTLPAAFAQGLSLKDIKVPSGMELKKLNNGYYTVVSKNAAEPSADGVELKKIGGMNLLVPKGMQVLKKGSLVTVESKAEYLARRLSEMEARFERLETEQKTLKRTIKDLKESANNNIGRKNINDLKQTRNTSIVVAK